MREAKGTVLIVDDEEEVRSSVARSLQAEGYSCVTAANGKEALKATSGQDFDLVLLDIMMPGMSGMEALPRIVADHPDSCVVMVTVVADMQTAVEAMKLGAYDYVTKPFSLEAISLRAEKALERKRLLQENRDLRLRLVEQKLEESEQRFKEIFDNVSDEIFYMDTDGKFLHVNERSTDIFGLPPDEVIGRSFADLDIFDPEELSRLTELYMNAIAHSDAKLPVLEMRARHRDGHKIFVEVSMRSITGTDGKLEGFLGIVKDITERRKAEEALQASRTSFDNIVEKSADGIIIVDREGTVCFVNPAAESLFKRETEELVGELFGFPTEAGETTEIEIIRPGAENAVAEMRIVETEWDGAVAYLASLRDITERKELDRMKTEFISMVSHELRTPLAIIRETVSQVLDGILGDTTQQQREFLHMCLVDVDRLARIINELLDVSKIEAKKLEIKREIVDLVALVREVSSIFYPRAKEKGLELKNNFSREAIEVYADRDRIVQVFTNLVSNALKFTEAGRIDICVVDTEDWVKCFVSDTGIGIPERELSRIFDRFQHSGMFDGAGGKGTGLGLSIAKGIVELHRGRIWAESVPTKGSRFSFALPKYSEDEILYERIERRITEAMKEDNKLSVFVIKLDNWSEIEEEFGDEKVQQILHKILRTFENVTRSGEFATIKGKNEVIVLAEVDKQDVPKMNARLIRAVKEAVSQVDEELEMNLSYGYSTYPDDASDAKDLLERAYESVVCEGTG